MKRILALGVAVLFAFAATACGNSNNGNTGTMEDMGYRVGVASYTVTDKSASSTESANGKGVVSTTYVTVVFDKEDVIKKVYIDEVQTKLAFDAKGQLVDNSTTEVKSKRELGYDYNMKAASPIGKEWFEQIDSLQGYLEGKVVHDIIGDYTNGGTTRSMTDNQRTGVNQAPEGTLDGTASQIMNGVDGLDTNDNGDLTDDSTAGGMTDNTTGLVDSTSEGNATDWGTGDAMTWQEDLKTSVTIDLTNIRMAIRKAYENAK